MPDLKRHWCTQYDPADGQPYGAVCFCSIGEDHDLAAMANLVDVPAVHVDGGPISFGDDGFTVTV